jgi:hypothetical protein
MVFRPNRTFIRLIVVIALVFSVAGAQYIFQSREDLTREGESEGLEITKLGNDSYTECADDFTTGELNEKEFIIRENEGLIAIYEVTPIGLRLVRQTDLRIDGLELKLRERIKTGIQVGTQEEIEHLLESWES